ncbi:hypothetical protein [Catalinimonas niigatensis]|uniref:hypothetical protein n=1 Tax=Catalinimonas niigatensis TaxID=1397264 RepID=UPI002665D0C2|nr:hypothetical protein [Catalinimonas niigatensis]WPP53242.1 hypothetical protein PZB72_12755 [Catalinimonas niigatensis]
MFGLFKKNDKKKHQPILADLNNQPLIEGDIVESLRYGLGKCRIIMGEKGLVYESIENGKQVSWHLMVDAATDLQKVKKITQV